MPATAFIALFYGTSADTARLVGTSSDRELVRQAADRMLTDPHYDLTDPVLGTLNQGRLSALRIIRNFLEEDAHA